jgi:major membrane immunogen (membrane-anchored lipoprotein)
MKTTLLFAAILLTGCSSMSDPYLKIGAGYKFYENKITHTYADGTKQSFDDPISARVELGFVKCMVENVSCGATHRSQWFSGAPFNDDKEYGVTEVFIDYTYKFGR